MNASEIQIVVKMVSVEKCATFAPTISNAELMNVVIRMATVSQIVLLKESLLDLS